MCSSPHVKWKDAFRLAELVLKHKLENLGTFRLCPLTISHALGGLPRHKPFLRGKCRPSLGPLLFPILFIFVSYVGYAHYVFSKYPLLLRKQSVSCTYSLRTPIPCPHGKQTRAEHGRHEVQVCKTLRHAAHTCTYLK